ncbi:hypothetical protein ACKLNR_013954 [Fusarium oxysporum f. sp. zingiberi]
MDVNPTSARTTAIRHQSNSNSLPYTTFYSPAWTAFQGTGTQYLALTPPDISQHSSPDRNQSIQSTTTDHTSSGTTSYSDYSTPATGYQPLISGTKQENK